MLGFVYDIETPGFYDEAGEVWTICLADLENPSITLKINPFLEGDWIEKFMAFARQYDKPLVVFHNGLKFDQLMLRKFHLKFGVGPDHIEGFPVVFLDTLCLSQYLNPDLDGHGIEAWGGRLGLPKIDYRQHAVELGLIEGNAPRGAEFMQHHDQMDVYCQRDVAVNIKVFWHLWAEFQKQYKFEGITFPPHYQIAQKNYYLMGCQSITGWQFDSELGTSLLDQIGRMMVELEGDIEHRLPPRQLKKGEEKEYTMPAKPFKKDGSLSAHMLNFIAKHSGTLHNERVVECYGKVYDIAAGAMLEATMPMKLGNQDDIKDWLLDCGWVPTFYNFKRGPDGKPERALNGKLIPTTPKIQDAGKICPNLMAMEGEIIPKIVKWLSLRNRQSVLTGWMGNPRLALDGRLPTNSTGSTPTHREKHSVVVNVPKASDKVLLGKEFRSLFVAKKGCKIAAGDAAALEGRVQGHYCVPMSATALTKTGWKHYNDLVVGEMILAYDTISQTKRWTPLLEKVTFANADVYEISNRHWKFRATGNHRWVVDYRRTNRYENYERRIVETQHLNTACNIIVNAPMSQEEDVGSSTDNLAPSKYGVDWVARVLQMSQQERKCFLEGFLIADGHIKNSGDGSPLTSWMWGQNQGNLADAALTASYLVHSGCVYVKRRKTRTNEMLIATLSSRPHLTGQRLNVEHVSNEQVWCPRTELGTWVMRQGDYITITGNTYRYDNGVTAEELLSGDPHSKNAKAFFPLETAAYDLMSSSFSKDDPGFKPYRDRSKNGFYAILYGAGAAKLASTLGLPESKGAELILAFWEANPATAMLKENVERFWNNDGKKKWLPGIDGRRIFTRKKSALLNSIFQSCGAIAMQYAICQMDEWLGGIQWEVDDFGTLRPCYRYKGHYVARIGFYHDELEYECDDEIAEEVSKMIELAIRDAGVALKLKIPLAGEGKVGLNWKATH